VAVILGWEESVAGATTPGTAPRGRVKDEVSTTLLEVSVTKSQAPTDQIPELGG